MSLRVLGRATRRGVWLLLSAAALTAAAPLAVQDDRAILTALRAHDLRLARIGERLALANVALCADRAPRSGLVLHDIAQYAPAMRDAAGEVFGFAQPMAVAGVIDDGAAAVAGVRANDALAAIDGSELALGPPDERSVTTERLIDVDARIVAAASDGEVSLALIRDGRPLTVTIRPPQGCATRFEVSVRDRYDARADGTTVQIATKLIEAVEREDELAFVVAHELAHNILRHRTRLAAAGVDRGLMEGFGRSVGFIRRSELEADLLAVTLLANAGYDPAAGARFWRWFGPAHFDSILLSRTHPRWSTRVQLLEREAARVAMLSIRPVMPPILAERDRPMSRDWQNLLAGL